MRAQKAEEQSRTRLETAINVASLGTFDWNTATGAVYADARSREIFGLPTQGELLEGNIFGRIAPEEIERVRAETSAALSAGHGHLNPGMHVLTKPFAMEILASRIKDLIETHKS